MPKHIERKFMRCVLYVVLFIITLFILHILAGPEGALPEWVFTVGLSLAVVIGLLTG
jgi:hypothetical protein